MRTFPCVFCDMLALEQCPCITSQHGRSVHRNWFICSGIAKQIQMDSIDGKYRTRLFMPCGLISILCKEHPNFTRSSWNTEGINAILKKQHSKLQTPLSRCFPITILKIGQNALAACTTKHYARIYFARRGWVFLILTQIQTRVTDYPLFLTAMRKSKEVSRYER